ncbi:MAG: phospholipase D-like domain-containing protein, partial [Chloroflexi bacterium]|nr:phospholipase D-like domain-containing protein [Chloroflexota bacterium]
MFRRHFRLGRLLLVCAVGIVSTSACGSLSNGPTANGTGRVVVENVPGTFFIEPDDGVMPIVRAINGARRSIDMTMYLLTDREVISALERSTRRGVHIRVLLEEHPVGSGPGNRSIYRRLEQDGIAVKWSNPHFRLTHEKSLVID